MNDQNETLQECIDRLIKTTEEIAKQIEQIKTEIGAK